MQSQILNHNLTPMKVVQYEADPELYGAYRHAESEIDVFWKRMGQVPDLKGKRVLDLGCGLGAMCKWAAEQGAISVVGVDLETRLTEFGRTHVDATAPELAKRIEFWGKSLESYQGKPFDVVITKDVFEHVMDLGGLLAELKRQMVPGASLYTGFGPIYNSPLGHHGRTHPWPVLRKLPWVHLLENEQAICTRLNAHASRGGEVFRYSDDPIESVKDLGLSMISFSDYQRAFEDSGMTIDQLLVNRGDHPMLTVLSIFRKIPMLKELCTTTIYCRLVNEAQ